RGLNALANTTRDASYVELMADNANYVWVNSLNEYGLPGKDWAKPSEDVYTWLLDAACMIELYSELIETSNN
ncbi:MAG: glycoside hydrolase family 76 protein, partial [Tannerellaceae bacterium]